MRKIALHLSRATWIALVFSLVLLAIIVSAARVVMPMVSGLRGQLAEGLSSTLETNVYLGQLHGRLHNFNPAITLDHVVIYQSEHPSRPSASFENIILELDTFSSLRNLEPVFRRVIVGGGELHLTGEPGHIGIAGFSRDSDAAKDSNNKDTGAVSESKGIKNALEVLSRQRQIDFEDIHLFLVMDSGQTHDVVVERLTLAGSEDSRKMSARIKSSQGDEIKLAMNISGHAAQWPDVRINGYLSTPVINFKKWLGLLPVSLKDDARLKFNQLRAGTEAWFRYSPDGWDIRGNLSADMVDIDRIDQTIPPLTDLRSDFSLKFGKKKIQQLWLNNLSFVFSGYSYPSSNLYIQRDKKPDRDFTIAVDRIHLQALSLMAATSGLLPDVIDKVITRLAPRGRVNNLVLKLKPSAEPFDLDLSAELRDVSVDHWFGAPSGDRVNAKVRMNTQQGVIDLDSRGFTLGLDNVFDDVWIYDRVAGKLYWNIADDVYTLRSDRVSLSAGEGDIEARLRLDIPFNGQPLWMALEAGITEGDALYAGKYLPTFLGDLNTWLNGAIRGGDISQGAFIWNGPLTGPDIPNDLTWGMFFDVANTDFAYDLAWPIVKGVNGLVTVDQDEVLVKADKARVYDSRATGVTALVPDLLSKEKPLSLKLDGQIASNGRDGLRILRETPIATALGHAADQWDMGGPVNVGLKLDIPLTKAGRGQEKIDVAIRLHENRFAIPDLDLEASNLNGELFYSTSKGLYGSGLTGSLFDKPVKANIKTTSGRRPETRIEIGGDITMASLAQWLKWDFRELADGETHYQARVSVGNSGAVRVDVDSDLVGVSSSMPAPLDKTKKQKLTHSVTVSASPKKPVTIQGSLASRLEYNLELGTGDKQIYRGGIRMGRGKATLPAKGLLLTGELESLQLKTWNAWWQNHANNFAQKSEPLPSGAAKPDNILDNQQFPVVVKDLSINKLLWGETVFKSIQVGFSQNKEGQKLVIKAPEAEGTLTVPADNRPLQVDLDRLNIPDSILPQHKAEVLDETPVVKADSTPFVDPLEDINPADIPDLDISIKDIRMGDQPFGQLKTKVRTVKNGVKTTELSGELGGGTFDGSLGWTKYDGKHHTVINASVDSRNVEEFLSKWGYPELMTGKRLKSSSYWAWEGSPAGFQMKNLEGSSDIEVKNGRFLSLDSRSSSALRLFGVLNVDAITRRLRLDFSDLFRSGMSFDQVEGSIGFNNGQINLTEPLTVKGPSSDFKLDGSLNVETDQIDMGLVVTLPVTQNIAVVSLLLGQPYIAGAAYLFDKLLGSSVEQFASLRYEIKGALANPDVKLDKLFSNKSRKNKKESSQRNQ